MQFFRYYHTLKNLKPVQIFGRFVFAYRRKFLKIIRAKRVAKIASELKEHIELNGQTELELTFLNKPYTFRLSEMQWKDADFKVENEKLWLYNLNYFDWINSEEPSEQYTTNLVLYMLLDWISQNADERAETWEPYPLSKRLSAWVKWLQRNKPNIETGSVIKLSISQQLKRLFVDMEYHNQANHLLENLRGFLSAGAFLAEEKQYFTNELEYQLEQVVDDLIDQLQIQFLSDGAHYERSPMYHADMLEAVKDIKANAALLYKQKFLVKELLHKAKLLTKLCESILPKLTNWLKLMTMPDGMVAQFNDCARVKGISHNQEEYAELLGASGYFISHDSDKSFIMSCGEPSPAYQPGHTHCDIMSYELAIKGNRCIIDTGCGSYQNTTLRLMSRQTEAHNLPMTQHQEQSDIWGSFRIGKRARITERTYNAEMKQLTIAITDQFGQKLKRTTTFSPNSIKINDKLLKRRMTGNFISLIHLAPEVEPELTSKDGQNIVNCKLTNGQNFSIISTATVRIDDYISFPEFGKSVGAKVLILSNKEAETLDYDINW